MIQKNRKSRIKDETLKAFILSALFLSLFFFNLNFISAEEFGYTYLEPGENLNQVTYLNYTEVNVNNSNFWAGYTPTTYYTYIKGLLDTAYDLVYCKLTGCTMTGNLITSGNITADTYFGDGSELTGTMDYTNVALINQTNTFTKNQTMTGTRNQLGLNFWSCQLTPTSNLILTANLTKSIADGKC